MCRAAGIEYRNAQGEVLQVNAVREVVLSAGAIGSPHILMLSGIGPRHALESTNVECRVDLPDVGKHLKDHLALGLIFDSPHSGTPLAEAALWKLLIR
jgi:choline dehydrogenase-like flavoprotein